MGRRLPFEGRYNEGTMVSNRPSSTNLDNQKPSATNMAVYTDHTLFPHQPAVPKSRARPKTSKCRFCQKPNHDIKSCHPFHTNGEGIVQDDDSSRKFGYSIVYYFLHKPRVKYTANAAMLANPPRRELCCQSEYSTGTQAKDYLLDRKADPVEEVEEGQSHYFLTNIDKVSTTNKTGKRKRGKQTKPTLEERLIHLERLYIENVPACFF